MTRVKRKVNSITWKANVDYEWEKELLSTNRKWLWTEEGIIDIALNLESNNVGVVLIGDSSIILEGNSIKVTGRIVQILVSKVYFGLCYKCLSETYWWLRCNFNIWISVNWTSYSKYYFETFYAWASLKRACLVKTFRDCHLNREKENYIYVLLILVKNKPMKICIQEKQMSFSRFIIDIIIWMGNIK